jgi:hypothetical protein
MDILGNRKIPSIEKKSWWYVFKEWFGGTSDKPIKALLLNSRNPDVAAIALEVQNGNK